MSLLVVSSMEKSFGMDTVLSGVTFRLAWRQKLGLVGRNGTGKTTLLRILTGQMEPDRGSYSYAGGVRFGYLRQEQMVEHGWTVYEEAEDAFAPVLAMEARLRELEHAMADAHEDPDRLECVMGEYSLMHDRFEAMGGYENLRDIHLVLQRLGFSREDQGKPTAKLSGGEKTRLAVAKLLLSAPDVLLLDEPTNHLDLEATEWLEGFLKDFGGAVVLVSHDRIFLDRVVTTVAELDRARLSLYHGNFSAYWMQREERRKREAETWERQKAEADRMETFFEKWKNTPSRRSQAVMRMRWAERIRGSMGERPVGPGKGMKLALKTTGRSGDEVVILDRLTKRFGDRTLFDDVSLLIRRGERVGIVGPNGAGKSTLVRILLGREQPTSGMARLGANVSVGYFAQEASDLDLEATVLDNMMDVDEMLPGEARTHLGRFLFTGDDAFRRVADCSGGEKNKLALAQLTWLKPNLLVLDEPTNHLDIDSREALTHALTGYDGTLLLISHDRYLLDAVTNRTLEVSGGHATLFDGPYRAYRQAKERGVLPSRRTGKGKPARPADAPPAPKPGVNPLTAGLSSGQLARERQKAVKAVAAAEKRVSDAEDWQRRIEEALSAPEPGDDIVKLALDHERAQAEQAAALEAWEKAVEHGQAIGAEV